VPRYWSLLLALAFAALLPAVPVSAQSGELRAAYGAFGRLILPRMTREAFLLEVADEFGRIGAGRETISESDLAIHRTMLAASRSASYAAETMRADIDRDGAVTEDEMLAALTFQHRSDQARLPDVDFSTHFRESVAKTFENLDANEDGRISWAEAADDPRVEKAVQSWGNRAKIDIERALAFDADGDGQVTPAEFRIAAESIFDAADSDSDSVLSEDESKALRENYLRIPTP
jgi:Ca2+-binding EF-hand superfamily protein